MPSWRERTRRRCRDALLMTEARGLIDVVRRPPLTPWADGGKIPWDDPDFSRRMLSEHLEQAHGRASRPAAAIEAEVGWLHTHVLGGRPSRVLDLGCGPGLYTSALARRGHASTGIDFGPASIAYARDTAARGALDCTYVEADLRDATFGEAFDLVLLIQGELHTFPPAQAQDILGRAASALRPGGRLVLEALRWEAIRAIGERATRWTAAESGLWSDAPYVELYEATWDAESAVSVERWHIIDAAAGHVRRYGSTTQAYTDADLVAMVERAGLAVAEWHEAWPGTAPTGVRPFVLMVTERR